MPNTPRSDLAQRTAAMRDGYYTPGTHLAAIGWGSKSGSIFMLDCGVTDFDAEACTNARPDTACRATEGANGASRLLSF